MGVVDCWCQENPVSQSVAHRMSGQEPTTDSRVLVLSWTASWMCGGFVDVECAARGGMGNTA